MPILSFEGGQKRTVAKTFCNRASSSRQAKREQNLSRFVRYLPMSALRYVCLCALDALYAKFLGLLLTRAVGLSDKYLSLQFLLWAEKTFGDCLLSDFQMPCILVDIVFDIGIELDPWGFRSGFVRFCLWSHWPLRDVNLCHNLWPRWCFSISLWSSFYSASPAITWLLW